MSLLIIVFAAIMMAPLLLGMWTDTIKLLIQGYLAVNIFMFVRGFIGPGVLCYALSGILIYIFIVRLYWLYTPAYMLYLVVGLGFSSILFFGIPAGGIGNRQTAAVKFR